MDGDDHVRIRAQPLSERVVISGKSPVDPELVNLQRDRALNYRISKLLPANYNFDLHRLILKIRRNHVRRVALQFPEGLFIFSAAITDIIETFTEATSITIGDVTFGACCVEDFTAQLIGCELLVHFAHSCLIPYNSILRDVRVHYAVVDIKFDVWHFTETVKYNFPDVSSEKIAVCGTIQFVATLQNVVAELHDKHGYNIFAPQARPLSRGEILGCTAPKLEEDVTAVLFVADGRFHLEAMMIANPQIKRFYRYNPYDKKMTLEGYDFDGMVCARERNVRKTVNALASGCTVGIVLGTLGHQGSPKVVENLRNALRKGAPRCKVLTILLPEIKAHILKAFGDSIDVWVQTSCPRLSIDWGEDFIDRPLLSPFELNCALKNVPGIPSNSKNICLITDRPGISPYPMDYYATASVGSWTPLHRCSKICSSCSK